MGRRAWVGDSEDVRLTTLDIALAPGRTSAAATTATYFPLFDYLRFVLAALVVLGHSHVMPDTAAMISVRVFFALSGWLIGGILLRTQWRDVPRFFFNRATRIWIPYAAAIILLYGLSALLEHFTLRRAEIMFYDVTFTRYLFGSLPDFAAAAPSMAFHGGGIHFWSIGVEEQFYLIAPLIILLTWFGRSPIFWGVVSVALLIMRNDFAAITFGLAAATLQFRYGDWHLKGWAVALLLFGAITSAMMLNNESSWPIFSICVVLLLARPSEKSAIGAVLGGISYPLYLNHPLGGFPSHSLVKHLLFLLPAHDMLTALFGLVIGIIMYCLVDRPVIAMRNSYYTEARGRELRAAAYAIVGVGIAFGVTRWYVIPLLFT